MKFITAAAGAGIRLGFGLGLARASAAASALKDLRVPVVRWPGGCLADEYHWREGIGARVQRPVKVNTTWGGVTESNAVGTHELFDLVEQLGADAYVNGNLGTATSQDLTLVDTEQQHALDVTLDVVGGAAASASAGGPRAGRLMRRRSLNTIKARAGAARLRRHSSH